MEFENPQCDGAGMQGAVFSSATGTDGHEPRWPHLYAQLAPVFDATAPDPAALLHAANVLSCWADVQCASAARAPAQPAGVPSESDGHAPASGDSASLAAVSALSSWPLASELAPDPVSVFAPADGLGDAAGSWARWTPLDDEGNTYAKIDDGASAAALSSSQAGHDAAGAAETEPAAEPEVDIAEDTQVDLEFDEESAIKKPRKLGSWSRSTTPESREAIGSASDKTAQWQKKVKSARDALAKTQSRGLQDRPGERSQPENRRARKKEIKERQRLIQEASEKLQKTKRTLKTAKNVLDKTRRKNRDPIGDAERKEAREQERARKQQDSKSKYLKEKAQRTKNQIAEYKNKIAQDPKNRAVYQKAIDQKKIAYQKAKSERRAIIKDKLSRHVQFDVKGTLAEKDLLNQEKIFGRQHKVKDQPSVLGSKVNGKTETLALRHSSTAKAQISKDGISGNVEYKGTAALFDYQRTWDWSMPHQLLGEDMNAKLSLQVRAFIGAEASAKLEGKLGKTKPTKPEIDTNGIIAEVGAFAGAKLQLGVGAAYEWNKKSLAAYQPRLQNSARALLSVVGALGGPLGYLLAQMAPASGVEKLLGWLLEYGSEGSVALLGLTAKGEASAGAGFSVKGAVGLRKGKLVAQVKANATWGLGLGGEVELLLDLVEGPLFLLLTLGQPELRAMAYDYVLGKLSQVASFGIQLGAALYDWFTSDDKARELVAHNGHQVLALSDRVALLQKMTAGYCGNQDELAILTVLRDAKQRGDLSALVAGVGRRAMTWNIDGKNNDELRKIIGD